MEIKVVSDHISRPEVKIAADETFGDMVKAVVDVDRGIMALSGEMHADAEAMLLQTGSQQESLWGINLYPDQLDDKWIEFDSMINIRPRQGNRSRDVEDTSIRERIRAVVHKLVSSV